MVPWRICKSINEFHDIRKESSFFILEINSTLILETTLFSKQNEITKGRKAAAIIDNLGMF